MGSVAVARSQVETKEKVPGIISDISSIFTHNIPAPGAGPRHGGSEAHPAGAADPGAGLRAGHAAPDIIRQKLAVMREVASQF